MSTANALIHRPVDYRLKPPYPARPKNQPVRRKPVTIAAGFRCLDGIVVAADTELTYAETLKYQESKVRTYDQDGVQVAVTGAGSWEYLRMALEKIIARIPQMGQNLDNIEVMFESVILGIYEDNIALHPGLTDKPSIDLIMTARVPDGRMVMVKSSDTAFSRDFQFEITGIGELLGRHLGDLLYDSTMTVKQGAFLSAYILRLAKKYVPGVGGRSDIVTLTNSGTLQTFLSTEISQLEDHFAKLDAILRSILLAVPDIAADDWPYNVEDGAEEAGKASNARFEQKLVTFGEQLREFRNSYKHIKFPPFKI